MKQKCDKKNDIKRYFVNLYLNKNFSIDTICRVLALSLIFFLFVFKTTLAQEGYAGIIRSGDLDKIEHLLKTDTSFVNKQIDSYGWTPLLNAIESRRWETVKLLLSYGADINKQSFTGWSALTRSVEINHKEFVDFFCSIGADIPFNTKRSGLLLHKAARGGHIKLTEKMIEREKVLPGIDDIGNTLLHSTAIGGLEQICEILIARGFKVDIKNNYDLTPLHLAAMYGNAEVVVVLLKNGAAINEKSFLGKTALHFALENGHDNVANILKQYGATEDTFEYPEIKGDYLGQKAPGLQARIFAQELISSFEEEHGVAVFSPDGNEVYWSRRDIRSTWTSILYMKRINDIWQKPQILPNTQKYINVNPFVTYDNQKLFYGSDRPVDNQDMAAGNVTYRYRLADGWSEPITMDTTINSTFYDGGPFITKDGTLYFHTNKPGGEGSIDLYYSQLIDGKYSKPTNLGSTVNCKSYDSYVCVAPDNSYLIFESYRPNGYGSSDLYISFKGKNNEWKEPINMGDKINSTARETFPMLSPDGKYLFFSSSKKGKLDTYWIDASVIDMLR